jgi:hypothetical protein
MRRADHVMSEIILALTPALSPAERVNRRPPPTNFGGTSPRSLRITEVGRRMTPSPGGEGGGEGECFTITNRELRLAFTLAACILAVLFFASVLHAAEAQVNLLAIGDWGVGTPAQAAVASAMAAYDEGHDIGLDARWLKRQDRAKFARSEHGFAHLQFTADKARVSFVNKDGRTLHVLERNGKGEVIAVNGSALTRSGDPPSRSSSVVPATPQ